MMTDPGMIATATMIAFIAMPGLAATMTFDSLPDEGAMPSGYSENGITASGLDGTLAWFTAPGALHVDDSGTGFASTLGFVTGGLFNARGFNLTSPGYNFQGEREPLTNNLFVSGFLGGALVGSAGHILEDESGTLQSILLGAAFSGIDRLEIVLGYPANSGLCDAPCGHFDLHDITLDQIAPAPVPLPATGGLLAFVLGGVGALSLRRRRA